MYVFVYGDLNLKHFQGRMQLLKHLGSKDEEIQFKKTKFKNIFG